MPATLHVWPSNGYNSSTSTKKLWEQISNARGDAFPREVRGNSSGRLAAVPGRHEDASPPNNLPSELSSFVGREKELAEVMRLLEDARLLTLTGSGGCGKTRLALAAAGELAEGFEDGVWLVELAPLADPSHLPQAVASTVGAREQPGRSLSETLSDHLRAPDRRLRHHCRGAVAFLP